jgi:prepilin-type processing-associated H-X9-DG protein
VRRLYGVVLAGGTAATNFLGRMAPEIRPEMLPALPKVEKYVWPDISAVSSDAKGILIESYGSLGQVGWMVGLQGPMFSVLYPALHTARSNARQAVSAANLHGLGKGIAMYQADHEKNPPDLLKLVEARVIHWRMLYSPSSGRQPRLDAGGKPVGPFDYVYLGAQMPTNAPQNMVLAYERPEIAGPRGRVNVLYADFHVQAVSMAQFAQDLKRTQDFLKKSAAGGA